MIGVKFKLVQDWRNGWKWLSVQMMALSAAIQYGNTMLPAELHDRIPADWWQYIAGAMLALGVAGRFIEQELGAKNDQST